MAPLRPGRLRNKLIALTTIILFLVTSVSATCFLPNSTDRNTIWDAHGSDYQPSGFGSPIDDFQMCCATNNRAIPDTPRKDGLCQNVNVTWRESCTDPTWTSPSCVKLCITGITDEGVQRKDVDIIVTQCPDLSYCCDAGNTTCCDEGNGVWIKDGEETNINPFTVQTTTSSETIGSATAPPNPPPVPVSPSPSEPAGHGTRFIATIATGAVVVVVVSALAVWLFTLRRKRRRCEVSTQIFDATAEPGRNVPSVEKESYPVPSRPTDRKEDWTYSSTPEKDGESRVELVGEGRLGDKNRVEIKPIELMGSMPTYRELE
ncbi:MAG: hypothetical protein Q9209_007193 [Squamulea sp. 1 TL-2023]